ncbi:hypothetical protein MTP99_005349 [Tenebrio molitor]|nr:hypothetical protein MTP99_005349 [Tenebrio molitor]
MDNNDPNKISNEMKQHCDNKGKLKKKCIKEVKQQDSPCSGRNYEHNGETPNLWKKRVTPEKQKEKGISMFVTTRKCFGSSSQLRFDSYKKRAGTTDLGKDYEKLMCALFALKFSTSDIVADFEMKTNSDDCGDFDDVALKVTFVDGQSQMFLLQLKHSENMKKVTEKKFAAESGDFSLPKDKKIEDEKKEEIVVRELQDLDPQKLLLMNRIEIRSKKEGTKVFQFELNQSSESVEGLADYLKCFYLFALQTNTTGAQSLVNAMLREKCGITDATYSSSFIQFMETW